VRDFYRLGHSRLPGAGFAGEQSHDHPPIHLGPGVPAAVLARNHVGWRHMDATLPNAGHRALAALQNAGVVTGVITQNVDLLHTKAAVRTC